MRIIIAMPKAIFFDAAGTLIRLTKSVGAHYALVAERQGLKLDPEQLDARLRERLEGNADASRDRRTARRRRQRLVARPGRASCSIASLRGSIRSIATLFSRPPMGTLRRLAFGNFIPRCAMCSTRWRRVTSWRSFQISMAGCALFSSTWRSRNISGTFFFPANWARINPIR